MEKGIDFYKPFFKDLDETHNFVKGLEKLGPGDPMHPAKIMMHQVQRLVTLADDLPKIRPQRESLQLLFILICAEHIAKLHDNFDKEGQSRAYTRRFFEVILSDIEMDYLKKGFSSFDRTPLSVREIVDLLYDVRCDVVHEGSYWGFHFHDGKTPMLNTDPDVIVNIRLSDLRTILVRGCINAITTYKGCPDKSVEMDRV